MTGKRIKIVLFIISTGVILWMTILSRHNLGVHIVEMRPFWALQDFIKGDTGWKQHALYWIENVLLFMPFGLLFPSKDIRFALIAGVIFSIVIEAVQYFACLGLCELDDVICNGLGSLLGNMMFAFARKIMAKAKEKNSAKST